jgi:sensor histidine kinase YesM
MKTKSRLALHIIFWLVYFSVTLFNELYLTSDFAWSDDYRHFSRILFCEINLLLIKIALVYYVLNSYLHRWIARPKKTGLIIEGVLIFLFTVVLYRLVIHFINWKLILHEVPPQLTIQSLTARFFYSALEIMQVLTIAATIKLFRMRIRAIENEKELIRERMKAELDHLKSQINPHFLFNTLNSIYSLALMQSEKTPELVSRLSDMLRFMLYESDKVFIPVKDEISLIEDYIDMQQIRFENRVSIKRLFETDNPELLVPPLLLFPFIENAFKHGVGGKGDGAFIDVELKIEKGNLQMRVKNSVFHESVGAETHHGIGLNNLRKQLNLLYRKFELNVSERASVYEADLKINLETYAGLELYHRRR